MGKKRRRKQDKNRQEKRKKKTASPQTTADKKIPAAPRMPHSKRGMATPLPLPFPSDVKVPTGSFLRNEPPYQESFQAALDTAYEGFVVDTDEGGNTFAHDDMEQALTTMHEAGFFRTDITQPFGLGTKCAKTYVTRCLVGEPGTTYKYLGLRMFSHPWSPWSGDSNNKTPTATSSLDAAVDAIRQLNKTLTERTSQHLSDLDETRKQRGGEPTRGRAGFDIALINRMDSTADLKQEPSLGEGKCCVSWHADSSLEHYSTIAVYQTITKDEKKSDDGGDWSVALRVAHNSEGPEASRRGTDIQSVIVTETPSIAVTLPSGSAYYLLDDFNHHHQHAVLAGTNAGIRYSSTHRLLRSSHNVHHVLERCKRVCATFHKKGPKIWRSEQLLLSELESEWIRQFYIQGQQHCNLLWTYWGDSIQQLLRYWSQLETRTKQTIDFLRAAAESQCWTDDEKTPGSLPPEKRMKKGRRRKVTEALEELISRTNSNEVGRESSITALYEPVATLLRERAEMRRLWKKREQDHVFREVDRSQRPLPVPFHFSVKRNKGGDSAVSPLPGSPDDLTVIADRVEAWGRACSTRNPKDLPPMPATATSDDTAALKSEAVSSDSHNEHCVSLTWKGWGNRKFGLEMQSPWAGFLLERKKTIETRAYDVPPALLGKRIEILQSKQGNTMSSLSNTVSMKEGTDSVARVGWCTFTTVIRYEDKESFEADEDAHMVKKDSAFGWKEGTTKVVYGWVVGEVGLRCVEGAEPNAIVRRYRSLFELQFEDSSKNASSKRGKRKKKRRRR